MTVNRAFYPASRMFGRSARAFSLVELLTALSVFSLLGIILVMASQGVGNVWVSTQNRTNVQQNARAIMDFVTKDLQCALPPLIPESTDNLQLIRNPSSVSNTYRSGHTLFWQAPVSANESEAGDIAIIGYFIRWNDRKAVLCRLFVSSKQEDDYRIGIPDAGPWVDDALLEKLAPASKERNYLGLMAENVVGFWAEPLDAYGNVIETPPDFDSRQGYVDSAGSTFGPGSLPPAIRVSIALIAPNSVNLLPQSLQAKANAAQNADAFLASVLADEALKPIHTSIYTYTTTITLINSR